MSQIERIEEMREEQDKAKEQVREILSKHYDSFVVLVQEDYVGEDAGGTSDQGFYHGTCSGAVGLCELFKERWKRRWLETEES